MSEVTFRTAGEQDVKLILEFIRALAEYEHMLDQVVADPETLRRELFERHRAEVLFAVAEGREVGFALFFHNSGMISITNSVAASPRLLYIYELSCAGISAAHTSASTPVCSAHHLFRISLNWIYRNEWYNNTFSLSDCIKLSIETCTVCRIFSSSGITSDLFL